MFADGISPPLLSRTHLRSHPSPYPPTAGVGCIAATVFRIRFIHRPEAANRSTTCKSITECVRFQLLLLFKDSTRLLVFGKSTVFEKKKKKRIYL
jgi:hypothetical protein